jgi:hypothetical protein
MLKCGNRLVQEVSIPSIVKMRLVAIGVVGIMATVNASAADPRAGSWTLVSAQSSLDPANKLSIVSSDGTVHVVMTGETHLDFTADSGGKNTPVTSNPAFDQVQLHRISKKQVEVIERKNGAVVATIRNRLSQDGRELTFTTLRPGRPDEVSVWTRTGVAKKSHDPFAGDWTQDVTKTRLRQGMSLKFEAVGNDGVQFTGEYSYTARFDGKQYDVKNSRNDTVQLAQIDSHTVNATYRRDQQVTQQDRWVLAPDGKTMTLTTTGILETGQRFAEKLVFQRQ